MKSFLEKVPYPISGLMLAYAALGNYLGVFFGDGLKNLCGLLAMMIFVILLLKVVILPKSLMVAFDQLPIAGVLNTFPMGVMLLAVYIKSYIGQSALIIWIFAVLLNVIVMIGFTWKHVLPCRLEKVLANYFVTYVGVVCASVTAGAFQVEAIGKFAFIFGLVAYSISFIFVTFRYIKVPIEKEPLRPLIAIFAAPANLLVVGYVSLGLQWSWIFLVALWGLGLVTTLFAYYHIFKQRQLPFYPSFAAYTFPLVIGGIASLRIANMSLEILPVNVSDFAKLLAGIQGIIAVILVLYVSYGYTSILVGGKKA